MLLRCPQVEEIARTCAVFSSFPQSAQKSRTGWRRGGDSNPRDPFESTRVPGVRLKPGSATSPRADAIMHHADTRGQFVNLKSGLANQTGLHVLAKMLHGRCLQSVYFGGLIPAAEVHCFSRERSLDELVAFNGGERPSLKLERPDRGRRDALQVIGISRAQVALRLDVHPDRHRHRVAEIRS